MIDARHFPVVHQFVVPTRQETLIRNGSEAGNAPVWRGLSGVGILDHRGMRLMLEVNAASALKKKLLQHPRPIDSGAGSILYLIIPYGD